MASHVDADYREFEPAERRAPQAAVEGAVTKGPALRTREDRGVRSSPDVSCQVALESLREGRRERNAASRRKAVMLVAQCLIFAGEARLMSAMETLGLVSAGKDRR